MASESLIAFSGLKHTNGSAELGGVHLLDVPVTTERFLQNVGPHMIT